MKIIASALIALIVMVALVAPASSLTVKDEFSVVERNLP
jgi:hypothetical protein